jgi:hypothetical protein
MEFNALDTSRDGWLSSPAMKRSHRPEIDAIAIAIKWAGGVANLAARLGVSRGTIYTWKKRGNIADANVTLMMAIKVAMVTRIPLEHLTGIPGLNVNSEVTDRSARDRLTDDWWHSRKPSDD